MIFFMGHSFCVKIAYLIAIIVVQYTAILMNIRYYEKT